jgi:heme a synthase
VTRLARFARATLAWNVAVILWGAFVRASGSGAGCGAHWPLCNGEVVPRAPALETMIEFTHRLTSGAALLLVAVLAIWVRRARPRGHLARRAALASLVFILLFRLVAQNESAARALFMAGHLVNTFLLLAALTLTAHWTGRGAIPRRDAWGRHGGVFALALVLLVLVGTSGAVAALGDTLYPARSLLAGLGDDLAATTGLLVRLRLLHPILGAAGALAAGVAAARVLQSTDAVGPRRSAWTVVGLALVQVAAGLLNVALLAPVWMQILHLFLADVLWIALVLLAAQAFGLATPPVVHRPPLLSSPT